MCVWWWLREAVCVAAANPGPGKEFGEFFFFFLLTSFTCLAPEQFKLNLHLLNQILFYFILGQPPLQCVVHKGGKVKKLTEKCMKKWLVNLRLQSASCI